MIYKYQVTPELIRKLPFLLKYTKEIFINDSIISSENIRIKLNYFLNLNFGINTVDFVEMVMNTEEIRLENGYINYSYEYEINGNIIFINKNIPILENDYNNDIPLPKLNIRVSELNILTLDKILIKIKGNSMILTSNEKIKTYAYHQIERLDSEEEEECFISGKLLKIVEELDKNIVISFFKKFIAIHEFSDATTTSIFIHKILF